MKGWRLVRVWIVAVLLAAYGLPAGAMRWPAARAAGAGLAPAHAEGGPELSADPAFVSPGGPNGPRPFQPDIQNQVSDPGFENGPPPASGWTLWSSTPCTNWIVNPTAAWGIAAYSGVYAFWAGGYCNHVSSSDYVEQSVTIPPGCSADLRFYANFYRPDGDDTFRDIFYVQVGSTRIWEQEMSQANDTFPNWEQSEAFDLSAYQGQTVKLRFGAESHGEHTGNVLVDEVSLVVECMPTAPVLSPIDNQDCDGSYVVDWGDVSGATLYLLQEDDTPAFSSPTLRYEGSHSQYTISSQPGGTWYYRARASNESGDGPWSNVEGAGVAPGSPALSPISNPGNTDHYPITWSGVTGAAGYTLQEDEFSSFPSPVTRYDGPALQYPVTGQPGGTWYYRVQAYNAVCTGPWSSFQSATTTPSPLSAPYLLAIDNSDGDGEYLVDWSDVSGATGYLLEESQSLYFEQPVERYAGDLSQAAVTGQAGGTWYYRVRATGPSGNSPWSNHQSARVRFDLFLPLLARAYSASAVTNGGFESGDFSGWSHGGELSQSVTSFQPHTGSYTALLGELVPAGNKSQSAAWMWQELTVPAGTASPTLSFWYRIFTNDVYDWASFHVELRDGGGALLAEVLRDGYPGTVAPPAGTDLGWKQGSYDLSPYRGQTIRLWFEDKNEHDGAWGIWTYVDDVSVTP